MSRRIESVLGLKFHDGARYPRWLRAGELGQLGNGLRQQRALRAVGKGGVQLVDPPVHRELMTPAALDRVGHRRREREAHRRDEERRWDALRIQQAHQSSQPAPRTVLRRGERADGGLAEADRDRLVVHVEREQHGHLRAAGPRLRLKRAAGADRVHDGADRVHRPLPARLGRGGSDLRLQQHGQGEQQRNAAQHVGLLGRGRTRERSPAGTHLRTRGMAQRSESSSPRPSRIVSMIRSASARVNGIGPRILITL